MAKLVLWASSACAIAGSALASEALPQGAAAFGLDPTAFAGWALMIAGVGTVGALARAPAGRGRRRPVAAGRSTRPPDANRA